jgi:hypothetical protein
VESPAEQGRLAVCTEQVCAILDKAQLKALGAEANTTTHDARKNCCACDRACTTPATWQEMGQVAEMPVCFETRLWGLWQILPMF